jgi:hypothetical protein
MFYEETHAIEIQLDNYLPDYLSYFSYSTSDVEEVDIIQIKNKYTGKNFIMIAISSVFDESKKSKVMKYYVEYSFSDSDSELNPGYRLYFDTISPDFIFKHHNNHIDMHINKLVLKYDQRIQKLEFDRI